MGLCWGVGRGVEGGEGNKRGTISGEEECFGGGRREFGKGSGKVRVRVVSTIGWWIVERLNQVLLFSSLQVHSHFIDYQRRGVTISTHLSVCVFQSVKKVVLGRWRGFVCLENRGWRVEGWITSLRTPTLLDHISTHLIRLASFNSSCDPSNIQKSR